MICRYCQHQHSVTFCHGHDRVPVISLCSPWLPFPLVSCLSPVCLSQCMRVYVCVCIESPSRCSPEPHTCLQSTHQRSAYLARLSFHSSPDRCSSLHGTYTLALALVSLLTVTFGFLLALPNACLLLVLKETCFACLSACLPVSLLTNPFPLATSASHAALPLPHPGPPVLQ